MAGVRFMQDAPLQSYRCDGWVGEGIHQHDNNVPAFMKCPSFLSIHHFIYLIQHNPLQPSNLPSSSPSHTNTLALSNPMHPMLSTMRIPGLRRPVFLVLVASAVAALSLLFFSRQYVEITSSGGGQRIHVSGLKAKECLTREFAPLFSFTVHGKYHHSFIQSIHRFHLIDNKQTPM